MGTVVGVILCILFFAWLGEKGKGCGQVFLGILGLCILIGIPLFIGGIAFFGVVPGEEDYEFTAVPWWVRILVGVPAILIALLVTVPDRNKLKEERAKARFGGQRLKEYLFFTVLVLGVISFGSVVLLGTSGGRTVPVLARVLAFGPVTTVLLILLVGGMLPKGESGGKSQESVHGDIETRGDKEGRVMSRFIVLIEGERPNYHFVNFHVMDALATLPFDVPLRCAPEKSFYSTDDVLAVVSEVGAQTTVFYVKEGSPLHDAVRFMPEQTRLKRGIVLVTVTNGKRIGPAGERHPEFAAEECLVSSFNLSKLARTLRDLYHQDTEVPPG